MFGTHNIEIFLFAGIALNMIPGQDTLYILGRSLSQGREAGIISVLGVGTGCMIHVIAAAIGFYSLLAIFPPAFSAICMAGGLYLIWLGIMTLRRRRSDLLALTSGTAPEGRWRIFRQGVLTDLLNPKVALFFLAFLPQFIDPVAGQGAISFLFLGFIFLCTGAIWCMFIAISAASVADLFRNNARVQQGFDYFTCVLFIGLGLGILLGHI